MSSAIAIPVDLQAKRQARGESQEAFGKLLGVTRQQVYKYESGNYNIPTPQACEVAIMFDGITLEYKGVKLELRPLKERRSAQDDAPTMAGDWTSNAINSAQQARELLEWSEAMAQHLISIKNGRGAEAYLVRGYKEAHEARLAIQHLLHEGRQKHPHLVDLGIEMARRVAKVQQEGGCQFAAMDAFLAEVADRLAAPQEEAQSA